MDHVPTPSPRRANTTLIQHRGIFGNRTNLQLGGLIPLPRLWLVKLSLKSGYKKI